MKHETEIVETLRKRLGDGYDVELYRATMTNNQIREGIAIRREPESIGVIIYFADIIKDIQSHRLEAETEEMFLKEMVDEIIITYIENRKKAPKINADDMTKEQILRKIMPQAVSRERNVELLKNAPHKELLDIAIIYRHVLETNDGIMTSFVITNGVTQKWDISLQELDMAAKQYVKRENPYYIATIDSVINGLCEECSIEDISPEPTEYPTIYTITNKEIKYAAAVLAEPEILGNLAQLLQSDLFIFPSSVHEVMAISTEGQEDDIEYFRQMVVAANERVDPEEILGTSVYRYRRDSGTLEIA